VGEEVFASLEEHHGRSEARREKAGHARRPARSIWRAKIPTSANKTTASEAKYTRCTGTQAALCGLSGCTNGNTVR
jgi:hypothetical protein